MKFGGDGRPRKHSKKDERTIALCFLDVKKREPYVTQHEYAQAHNISARSLRRYMQRHIPIQAIERRQEALEAQKKELKLEAIDLEDEKNDRRGGFMTPWE